jgi:hypothetical protein
MPYSHMQLKKITKKPMKFLFSFHICSSERDQIVWKKLKKREDKTQSQTYKIYSIKQKEVYILIKNMESNHIPFYNNQSFFFFLSQKNILITELEFLSITFVFAQSVKKHLIFFLHLLQTLQLIQHQISLSLSVTTTLSKLCPENIKRK